MSVIDNVVNSAYKKFNWNIDDHRNDELSSTKFGSKQRTRKLSLMNHESSPFSYIGIKGRRHSTSAVPDYSRLDLRSSVNHESSSSIQKKKSNLKGLKTSRKPNAERQLQKHFFDNADFSIIKNNDEEIIDIQSPSDKHFAALLCPLFIDMFMASMWKVRSLCATHII